MAEFTELLSKANYFLKTGNIDDSIEIFTTLMERYPQEPLIFYNMGIAFIEKENYDISEKVFNHCLSLGYEDKRVFLGLGFCSLRKENYEASLNYFEKAIISDPDFPEAIIGKIYTYVKSGDTTGVEPLLLKLKALGIWNQELELVSKTIKRKAMNLLR